MLGTDSNSLASHIVPVCKLRVYKPLDSKYFLYLHAGAWASEGWAVENNPLASLAVDCVAGLDKCAYFPPSF